MPRLRPETEKARASKLIKSYSKTGFNQSRLAKQEGVSQPAINQRLTRKPVQQTLDEHIQKVAKRVGINLTWLLTRYKKGADEASKVIGYLHQYKKDIKDGKIEKAKPDEAISNEFIDIPDWNVKRLYLRDIAEIMKWIKQNGRNDGKGDTNITIVIDRRPANNNPGSGIHISRVSLAK